MLAEIQALCREQTPENIRRPIYLRDNAQSEQVQLGAIRELFNRGWGRPPQALLHKADTKEDSPLARYLK